MEEMPQRGSERNDNSYESDVLIVDEWRLNSRERMRVTLEPYKGIWLLNLRKWYEADDGKFQPSKRGIAVSVRHLPQLAEAVTQAVSVARDHDLIRHQQV
jgi:Transcriptional Coactivator p15 (PC4)